MVFDSGMMSQNRRNNLVSLNELSTGRLLLLGVTGD